MVEFIDITIRGSEQTANFAKFVGNEGVLLVLQMHVMADLAERCAANDDTRCYAALLERCVLEDVLDDFIEAKNALHDEADRLEHPFADSAIAGVASGSRLAWQEDFKASATEHDGGDLCATCGKTWAEHFGRCCDTEPSDRRFVKAVRGEREDSNG